MTIDHDGVDLQFEGGLWDGRSLYELYPGAHTPWAWHGELSTIDRELGQVDYTREPSEKNIMVFRRSLYVVEDVKARLRCKMFDAYKTKRRDP